ncbi:type II toxin-antitoxin system VapC family toxin [Leptospira santarosai]|uniref:type II toxin-antitoxin system VapC family toxin n=1 Tax=Leptospira santarosai TaxID=28183 RepID=UPI0002487EF6|nr:type II toxin-antitoxin system VapC family toxin [Leptospira santarosai]EMM78534.1 PIN domain protein [Leptospira santarosai str. 2000030832]MDI7185717.1 type II toxin-antitoxin system VapC family toxin [Leptospira santarosai]MDI7190103.1 type II toxin-antitoxin system VapC family toxin [Leptospira santarosai]MDI7198670.1 type II toxin-antitoxin system VapC family toxin [Leptospira santarosai]MDI7207710.1 type II toxin-antitoxin system VapC family toxin [Leptospira santarosai]
MNIVDSSGWLEYFSGTKRSGLFSEAIEKTDKLIVPTISLYEVFKKIYLERDENSALRAIAHMQQGTVIDLDASISIFAAKLSRDRKIPMADSIILATALKYKATLWTQDEDFIGLDRVKYFPKK